MPIDTLSLSPNPKCIPERIINPVDFGHLWATCWGFINSKFVAVGQDQHLLDHWVMIHIPATGNIRKGDLQDTSHHSPTVMNLSSS
jgi:hypothetical protein